MKKILIVFISLLSCVSMSAEKTLTVLYKNGTQKKVTFPDNPNFIVKLCQYDIDRIFSVTAYGGGYEPVSEEVKQEIKRLSKQIGDGTIENEKRIYDDGNCSYESYFEIIDKIKGIIID